MHTSVVPLSGYSFLFAVYMSSGTDVVGWRHSVLFVTGEPLRYWIKGRENGESVHGFYLFMINY